MKAPILFCLIILCATSSFAQDDVYEDEKSEFWKKVNFGGGVGLNFGNGFFNGTLAPNAVYNFNSKFATGVGLNFSYSSQRDVFASTIFGGSVLGLFNPVPEVQLSAELEQLRVNTTFDNGINPDTKDNFWASALFLGAGYRTGNIVFGIRYDVLYNEEDSIYSDPWLPFVRFWF